MFTDETKRGSDAVPIFVGWLCDGQSKEVFDFLRRLKLQGHSSKEFLTQVVCALDEMYRHRREGGKQCDTYMLLKTAHLDNKDIELTLELLAAGIDHSYEESHTGVKMACIRALDHTTKKNNTSSSPEPSPDLTHSIDSGQASSPQAAPTSTPASTSSPEESVGAEPVLIPEPEPVEEPSSLDATRDLRPEPVLEPQPDLAPESPPATDSADVGSEERTLEPQA